MDVEHITLRRYRGLTLVELIATVAVISISLAVVIPSWSSVTQRNQITTVVNQLITHLRYARSTAVIRNAYVSLCPSDDGKTCSGDPLGWRNGYLVFEDRDGNRQRTGDEPLLRVQGAAAPNLQLQSTAGRPAIRFRADGAAWSTNTTFRVCLGDDASAYRAVILLGTGRARTDRVGPKRKSIACL